MIPFTEENGPFHRNPPFLHFFIFRFRFSIPLLRARFPAPSGPRVLPPPTCRGAPIKRTPDAVFPVPATPGNNTFFLKPALPSFANRRRALLSIAKKHTRPFRFNRSISHMIRKERNAFYAFLHSSTSQQCKKTQLPASRPFRSRQRRQKASGPVRYRTGGTGKTPLGGG